MTNNLKQQVRTWNDERLFAEARSHRLVLTAVKAAGHSELASQFEQELGVIEAEMKRRMERVKEIRESSQ